MKRREFLGLTLGAVAVTALPLNLKAKDFRANKPDAWTSKNMEDALKALYGTTATIEKGVSLNAPKVASNGGAVPVDFSTEIPAKSVALLQDTNPEALVAVYNIGKHDVTEYAVKIKMAKSGTIMVVVEGQDGKLYSAKKTLDVALGGCEG